MLNLPAMPTLRERPTREDAEAARRLLLGLIEEFPFVDNASLAVGLSMVLSTVLRGALEQVPLHLVSAPSAGCGKSLLTDIASMIGTGERTTVVAASTNSEEQEKRLGAAMLSGRALIALDNLNGMLSSDLLCQAISQPLVAFRPLGASTEVKLACRSVFVANGNNISICDDLGRRTLLVQLDAGIEKPWQKQFRQNPLESIARDRGRYIAAALTIPLAYLAAGAPSEVGTAANGFEAWSLLVRAPLVWLGAADPASTMDVARGGDPKLQAKLAVFAAMANFIGIGQDHARTAAQIIDASGDQLTTELEPKRRALRIALMAIAPAGAKDISPHRLGTWLRSARRQIVGGMRLCNDLDRNSTATWWIERCGP
jgi:putative DNA primase/helicase